MFYLNAFKLFLLLRYSVSVFFRLYAFLLLDKVYLTLTPSLISPRIHTEHSPAHPSTSREVYLREFLVRWCSCNTTLKDE